MNVYEKMLKSFYKEKGSDLKSFTKEKDLESLLKTLSTCEYIKEKYGIDLSSRNLFSSFNVSDINKFNANVYMHGGDGYIGLISEVYNASNQPKEPEMLLKISHTTGAYIFGDYYPSDLFEEFFKAIQDKTDVKYMDPINHSLYYSLENTVETLKIYEEIYKEYTEKNKENYKKVMIERKKAELKALESN